MENLASLQTSIPPPARKRRRAITDAERKAIRDWWAAAPPNVTHANFSRTPILAGHAQN
jgi:hypothetical protein